MDASESNGDSARVTSYSTRERGVDHAAPSNHLPSQTSSVVTPTAQEDYSFTTPPQNSVMEKPIQKTAPSPIFEGRDC